MAYGKRGEILFGLPRTTAIVGGLILLVLALVFLTPLGSFLGATVVGKDVSTTYTPLVRAQTSQDHRYDRGSNACERNPALTKEFTVAYLFKSMPRGLTAAPVFGCHLAGKPECSKQVTLIPQDCTSVGLRSFPLGYIATTNDFEAPVPLYRCLNTSANDTLLTDDADECTQAGYLNTEQLGFAATAGHLPTRRLGSLCEVVNSQACSLGQRSTLCDAYATFCQ